VRVDDWFLTPEERRNPATEIDRRRGDGKAWTDGNHVQVLVDGTEYFRRLYEVLCVLGRGDSVHFTDWEGDPDELLAGPGTEVARVLADLARRGVHVARLVWRSHPRRTHFLEQQNARLVREINESGGEVFLDERVRRGGCHHEKLVVVRHASGPDDDVAFVGGIDLCHGRNDDGRHEGDPQTVDLESRYGDRPPWHGVHLEVRGPAVGDAPLTLRARWQEPTPLDHRHPPRIVLRHVTRQPRRPGELPSGRRNPAPAGTHAVQIIRTYPAKRLRYPFAPDGERSIGRPYRKAVRRARRLVYVEDQYLWGQEWAEAMADALRREPELRLIVRHTALYRAQRERCEKRR